MKNQSATERTANSAIQERYAKITTKKTASWEKIVQTTIQGKTAHTGSVGTVTEEITANLGTLNKERKLPT